MKKHLPNTITLVNLFCGCGALLCIVNQMYIPAFWFIFVGGVADYADGAVARMLGVHSELGKELDSLADMVTFGVVPGVIFYMLLSNNPMLENYFFQKINLAAMPAFLVTVFSGVRLAKFNLDTRQSEDFIGLNTPSSTMFAVGIMLIYALDSYGLRETVSHPFLIYPAVVILSILLISELPMFSMKFKKMQWKGNEFRIIFLITFVLMLIFLREITFSIIILLYVLFSLLEKVGLFKE